MNAPALAASAASAALRQYLVVTGGYWAFTITDGAIRMLVVLYFHLLGYTPLQVAMLFLFYELFGVVTNLVGGWLGARIGVNRTMHIGMALQIGALAMLTVPDAWLSVAYVMAAQALSGIAKDLNKMSAKASVKALSRDLDAGAHLSGGAGTESAELRLFRWVAALTGSKNALKGLGFFVGALLLETIGFRAAMGAQALALLLVLVLTVLALPRAIGQMRERVKFAAVFATQPAINWLAAARFFLFGARDVWFVVALPVFAYSVLGWSFWQVGAFMALWTMAYGAVQAAAPRLLQRAGAQHTPGGAAARRWVALLALCPALLALALGQDWPAAEVVVIGLALFGVVFAINSALHSYLILAYSEYDKVALNVGFYYMANAGGRLVGTLLSGLVYQLGGLSACLWLSSAFLLCAALLSLRLPETAPEAALARPPSS